MQLGVNLFLITQLGVEILAVGAGTHGGAEDRLDEPAMVRLEGGSVGGAEGVGELLRRAGDVGAEGNTGELKATVLSELDVNWTEIEGYLRTGRARGDPRWRCASW